MNDHAGEQHERERHLALLAGAPTGLECDAEDRCVDGEHQQRIEQGPDDAHDRSLVAADKVAFHKLAQQVAILEKSVDEGRRR